MLTDVIAPLRRREDRPDDDLERPGSRRRRGKTPRHPANGSRRPAAVSMATPRPSWSASSAGFPRRDARELATLRRYLDKLEAAVAEAAFDGRTRKL